MLINDNINVFYSLLFFYFNVYIYIYLNICLSSFYILMFFFRVILTINLFIFKSIYCTVSEKLKATSPQTFLHLDHFLILKNS